MRRLLAVVALFSVVSCGGDDPAPPNGDPGRLGDPGGHSGDEATGDPVVGDSVAGDPVTGDPVAGDSLTGDSGGDPSSGHSPGWPLSCDTPTDCSGLTGHACVGGGCVALVDPPVYTDEVSQHEASYWWTLQWPALFEPPERCCFDFTGDGRPDDSLGTLAGLMGSFPGEVGDPQATMDATIASGELVRMIDWRGLPADLSARDAWLSVLHGLLNGDGDGNTVDLASRRAGLSHVLIDPDSLGTHGSLYQLNDGAIASTVVTARGGPLVLPYEFLWVPMNLVLTNIHMQVPLRLDTGGCQGVCSVDEIRADHDPALVAGAQFGGVVEMSQILGQLDAALRSCGACDSGIDETNRVIWYEENVTLGTLDIGCCDAAHATTAQCAGENAPAASNTCGADDATVCGYSGTLCSMLGIFGGILDVDIDGDNINDALSAGFRVGLAGTTTDGLAGQSCGANTCDGAELCNVDTCECGSGGACDDGASTCFDFGAGPGCQCVDGAAGDALCGGATYLCIDRECVNTDEDARYCGSARVACGTGEGCAGGECLCGAEPATSTGGESCHPTVACVEDQPGRYRCECTGVLDGTYCGGWGTCCNGVCIEPLDDTVNCGLCGSMCDVSPVRACSFDSCECGNASECADVRGNNVDCCGPDNVCVDLASNPSHCGGCGINCDDLAPAGMVADRCDGTCSFRCEQGYFDCNGSLADGCEIDLWSTSSVNNCGTCSGSGCLVRVAEGDSLQTALDAAPDGALVLIEEGSYREDISITKPVMLVTQGIGTVSLEGIGTLESSSFPAVAPNIAVSANNVLIQGFDFYGPAVTCDQYASGIVVDGTDVEIAFNNFQVPTGAVSQGIQTVVAADVSGLSIHDNSFFHLTPLPDNTSCDPDAFNLYEAVMINAQSGGTAVRVERNRFEGRLLRAVWAERAGVVVSDNYIESSAPDPFVGQGNEGLFPVGVHVRAANTTVENNAIQRLTRGVAVDVDLAANTDVVLTGNCIDGTQVAAAYSGIAGAFSVDATGNYWGPNGAEACPATNCYDEPEVDVSAGLTICPPGVEKRIAWSPF